MPSTSDASPRILTQALTLNTAIIVNKYIAGGFKYVNEMTGSLIADENDIIDAIKSIKERRKSGVLQPRQWYGKEAYLIHQKLQIFIEMVRWQMHGSTDVHGMPRDPNKPWRNLILDNR